MKAHPEVVRAVHATLEAFRGKPLKRPRLRELVRVHGEVWPCQFRWSLPTWDRRIREAINALIEEGIPVVSDGTGFRIASSREELEAGLQRLERTAISLLRTVAKGRKIPLGRRVVQLGLFEAEEGAA